MKNEKKASQQRPAKELPLAADPEVKDHVTLGRSLDLFYNHSAVGKGLPLLTPKGTIIKQILIRFVEDEEQRRGYRFTSTPVLAKEQLYKISGHLDHFKKNMFLIPDQDAKSTLVLRPMTCPHQFILYNRKKHSYRDLPVRYAETSTLFRNEASGTMYGLIRIRQFTLADGHIICRPDQVEQEFLECIKLVDYILQTLGLREYSFRFSKWDPQDKQKYIDNPEAWEESQKVLKKILDTAGVDYYEAEGEAAFYGPKLDVQMKNMWGKEETIFTIQLDFALAERFDMQYVAENGEEKRPMIIHRSSIGCYERTLAMLIERYQGRFPFWLSPEQVRVIPLNDGLERYARGIQEKLMKNGIRVSVDSRGETLQKRILWAQEEYVPVMLIVGNKEQRSGTVSLRLLNGKQVQDVPLQKLVRWAKKLNTGRQAETEFNME
ncbi:MAG: threonine--tRNA ligase [Spirochaetales bacterium]|nr:threonine--tRNA ligase [Spirochaetales bacterium]